MNRALVVLVILILLAAGAYLLMRNTRQIVPTTTQPTQITPLPTSTTPTIPPTSTPSGTMNEQTVHITLTPNGFEPASITIKTGTKVVWTNNSGQAATINSDPHPIHTDFPPLNLGSFADGQSLSLTFTTPGTHGYHNHLNPSVRGTIIVQ